MKIIKGISLFFCIILFLVIGIKVKSNIKLVNDINIIKKEPIYKIDTEKKEVFLTFDINWAEKDNTYTILELLEKYDVKATFFIMGKWIKYPDGNLPKLKAIVEKGHDIGNHSYVHPDFTQISKERMEKEIKDTENILKESVNVDTKIFRFPSGAFSKEAVEKVYSLGYIPVGWDVDSKDWLNEGAEKEYRNVKSKITNGSIILYHNNGKYTPENIERLILELKNEGYEFNCLSKKLTK
ncbi:polysaccharide deacetylase family sporulation protein PdaB [Clostridium thermobutyricum]|uniref:Polysaccharide deacetylase family sporulation protein PdaB n=1 Tax=Clostridium thermobutyricum TaxID=29372 RepID=N9WG96_9CLOT|nr:polysaccharide deacetylase family protein [Clostridium thermobutyricum]ENZ01905.1 polysaccharide deacetylase family sporulation protein PdaB [Clostridium thermobutyricum]